MDSKSRNFLIASIILVAAIVLSVGYVYVKGGFFVSGQKKSPVVSQVAITQIDSKKIPDGFPTDFPMEKGAKVLQNYTAVSKVVSSNGLQEIQATREFSSVKTADQNFQIYKTYLSNGDWKINQQSASSSPKVLVAQETSPITVKISATSTVVSLIPVAKAIVSISANPATTTSKVDITIITSLTPDGKFLEQSLPTTTTTIKK